MEVTPKKAAPLLEPTGERYLPWLEEASIGYEHLHRYAYATQFVKNKRVLDLASGEGYGSYLLAKTAKSVTGIDIDETIQLSTLEINTSNETLNLESDPSQKFLSTVKGFLTSLSVLRR